jgi:hypothetical protein
MRTTQSLAALGTLLMGLGIASSSTHAAGPLLAPAALATSSSASASVIAEPTRVVVRGGTAVVRHPVARRAVRTR